MPFRKPASDQSFRRRIREHQRYTEALATAIRFYAERYLPDVHVCAHCGEVEELPGAAVPDQPRRITSEPKERLYRAS